MPLDSPTEIPIKVAVGGREVLQSGVVHAVADNEIRLNVDIMTFVFRFKSDDGTSRYTGTVEGEVLYIDLFNHRNSLGEGELSPIEIAKVNDKPIFVTYYLHTVGGPKNARRLEYVLYIGEAT